MTTFNTTAINLTAYPLPVVDAIALMQQPIGVVTLQPVVNAPQTTPLDEPSSLVLALIGVATLAAYRGVVERMAGRFATKPAPRPFIKPRRRAA
jgi:hypothetical protein